jgi:hypothetical protein
MSDHYGMGKAGGGYSDFLVEGEKWLAPDSEIQKRLDADGEGMVLIHEALRRGGELQEVIYVTDDPDLIREATAGHEQWVARQASRN